MVEGALCEAGSSDGRPAGAQGRPAGTSFSFGPEHIHRLTGDQPRSVSIHVYSPPLWRLGRYSIDPDGVMRRVHVSYADEPRPVETASAA